MVEPAAGTCSAQNPVCCSVDGTISVYCPPSDPRPSCRNACKWNHLVDALADPATGLAAAYRGRARFGYVAFPADNACAAPTALRAPPGADPASIEAALKAESPAGGTPTAAALKTVEVALGDADAGRARFAVLVTDGAPNCNPRNQPKCERCQQDPFQCRGSIDSNGDSVACNPTGATCGWFATNLCLDGGALVAQIRRLREAGVPTAIIGFGAGAATPDAEAVLDAAAVAGGLAAADRPRYYRAVDGEALTRAMHAILARVGCN